MFYTGVDGLYCFKCLSMDCPGDDMDCQNIRKFITSELKNLYYFNTYLDNCPPLNDSYNWRMMQIDDDPCPEQKNNEATCTLGRMELKTVKYDKDGKKKETFNYATVMGCANRQLLRKIQSAYEDSGSCDYTHRNISDVGINRHLQLEHCREISRQCFEKDYCVSWKESIVKRWRNKDDNRFDFTIKMGMLAVVVVVMMALLLAGMCRNPVDRVSNLPKSIGDDCETVKVLGMREKDELDGPKATIKGNGTGTLGRRPAHPPPPPPPPRLNRQSRGSTPV